MDNRQARLVAAAEALRGWVHHQRAGWSGALAEAAPFQRRPVFTAPSLSLADACAADETVEPPWMPPVESGPRVRLPTIGVGPGVAHVLERLSAFTTSGRSVIRRQWRTACLAACVVVAVGMARANWPVWRALVTKPVSAGKNFVAAGRRMRAAAVAQPAPARAPAPAAGGSMAGTGSLQVDSEPTGARVIVDGRERGVTPLLVSDVAPGSRTVIVRTDDGSIQRTVAVVAGQTTNVKEAIYSGWLHVSAPLELQISEGSRPIRLDDSNHVLLSPGAHVVTFENRALGFKHVQHLTVRPGATTAVSIDPPPSSLSVTASEPAEVTIDGEAAGSTPLTDIPVRIGTRDVSVKAASGAVRRISATVSVEPARVDVDFTRP